jgi:menaquinone-dependent protoporphyrinogen oxidase
MEVVMKVLVTAATRHGATKGIAEAIGRAFVGKGLSVQVLPIEEVSSVDDYDAVVLGSALYLGRWLGPAMKFVERHHEALAARPTWVFSSGPVGADARPDPNEPWQLPKLAEEIHFRGHRVFRGRLDRHVLGLGEKLATRAAHLPEGDFRPWGEIETWDAEIAATLMAGSATQA